MKVTIRSWIPGAVPVLEKCSVRGAAGIVLTSAFVKKRDTPEQSRGLQGEGGGGERSQKRAKEKKMPRMVWAQGDAKSYRSGSPIGVFLVIRQGM